LWGTLIGGIVLGIAQSIGAQVHPQGFLIAGHVTFLIVLLARVYVADTVRRWIRSLRPGAAAT
jgi:branched-chain amino acid transport system permease protein